MAAVVGTALEETVPQLLSLDLAPMEQQVQQLGRRLWGQLIALVLAQRARLAPQPVRCPACAGRLRQRERPRQMQGVVGDYTVVRTYYWCAGCGQSQVPLDADLGLGPGVLSPGLARVVARAALEAPFAQAVETVQEALGVAVSAEVARRTTEGLGAVAEAQTQAAIERAAQGASVWPPAEVTAPPDTTLLAVEVDGVQVQRDDGWHEMKVLTLAPLGPNRCVDAQTGRTHLAWGTASYGAGTEGAEDFWWRVYVEACRRGLGTPAVRTVVVLGDGAAWIWERARAFLSGGATEVVEIVDIYHAYGYLWDVGNAVFGAGSAEASAWVEPLKDRLYEQGPAPILAALATLTLPNEEALKAHQAAVSYFTTHAARMDYPRFVARHWPIGSGAVESSCKCLVEARAKQAGMRWSSAGLQHLTSLRALHRSGRWAAFWQTQPQRLHHQRPRPRPVEQASATLTASPPPADIARPVPLPAPPLTAALAPPPRPKPTARQRPLLLPRSV
jgi:hypothetical protein